MKVEITNYDKIIEGLNLTYKRLLEFKKSKNSPLVVSRDGKVVHLNPFTLEPIVEPKEANQITEFKS